MSVCIHSVYCYRPRVHRAQSFTRSNRKFNPQRLTTIHDAFYFQHGSNAAAKPQNTWDRYRNPIFIYSVYYNQFAGEYQVIWKLVYTWTRRVDSNWTYKFEKQCNTKLAFPDASSFTDIRIKFQTSYLRNGSTKGTVNEIRVALFNTSK